MYQIENKLMCDEISKKFDLKDNVRKAICEINREMFIPQFLKHMAYDINPVHIGNNQFISSPLTVAKMTQYLIPENGDSVLEIGCGSGYQAAVLSKLFRRVFTIERIEKLLLEAKERFRKNNFYNINAKFDDGKKGWVNYAPYDRVLFSACIDEDIPEAIIEQMPDNGILVAPIKYQNSQAIARYTKKGSRLSSPEIMEKCDFVPVLNGVMRGQ